MLGSLVNGTPSIRIEVSGWNTAAPVRLNAVVDTGFNGFLLLPIFSAFPLGLVLHGLTDITLADGSTRSRLVCNGNIHFETNSKAASS